MSAWASQVNFRLGQISVDSKSNEIPAVQELLEILNLNGAVVAGDAVALSTENGTGCHGSGCQLPAADEGQSK